jgi:hypothetical protein
MEATNMEKTRAHELTAELRDIDDGTGDLGVIVRQALADDPDATAADIRAIVAEARADAETERGR